MSNVFSIIKTIWKNERYRSLFIMGLYFIFFLSIILIAKMAPNSPKDYDKKAITNIDTIEKYDFEVSVKDSKIIGSYDYSYIKFTYNDVTYEYSNEILLPTNFPYMDIIKFMDKNYVYSLIKDKDIYSTTKFSDDTKADTYLIDEIEITTYDKDLSKIDVKINDVTYKIVYK